VLAPGRRGLDRTRRRKPGAQRAHPAASPRRRGRRVHRAAERHPPRARRPLRGQRQASARPRRRPCRLFPSELFSRWFSEEFGSSPTVWRSQVDNPGGQDRSRSPGKREPRSSGCGAVAGDIRALRPEPATPEGTCDRRAPPSGHVADAAAIQRRPETAGRGHDGTAAVMGLG
jgi:hypothetical protein